MDPRDVSGAGFVDAQVGAPREALTARTDSAPAAAPVIEPPSTPDGTFVKVRPGDHPLPRACEVTVNFQDYHRSSSKLGRFGKIVGIDEPGGEYLVMLDNFECLAAPMRRVEWRKVASLIELTELEGDPHPALARLRATEPVAWLPALGGWLVTGREPALEAMRAADRFTVDDPRFTTARVVGASMLSTDGAAHDHHREPFTEPFRRARVHELLGDVVARRTDALIDAIEADGEADLSARLAAPLAASVVTHALGLAQADVDDVLGWYRSIVASVQEMTAGGPLSPEARGAFAALREAIGPPPSGLTPDEAAANAGVLLFGGIETTEGMIANAVTLLLEDPEAMAVVRERPGALEGAIEETLRLEPAAAIVDRYATGDTELGGAAIRAGDLVSISVTAANRDPATFPDPDRFDPLRANARRHLAFASGPHACIGVHLARLEAAVAVGRTLERLPGLRLNPDRRAPIRGLVFRKPATLHVRWDPPAYVG